MVLQDRSGPEGPYFWKGTLQAKTSEGSFALSTQR